MSFRDFMRGTVDARSVCVHCGKPIERRVTLWYATGEDVGSDLCLKNRRGDHVPIEKKLRQRR